MTPEVTAVITTHARPAFVREALASVQAETHEDLEIVVVDDGGAFDPPPGVHVMRGSKLGVARARNLGLEAARGEFIIYLDDDDVALPNRISSLLHAARQSQASLCFGMTRRVMNGVASLLQDVPTHHGSAGAAGFGDLLMCAPHVNAVLVRTKILRAIGGFDVDAHHFDDWSAWLRIADREGAVWRIAETVAEWRIHSDGLSGKLLHAGAMKLRLLALFQRLRNSVSPANAQAIVEAQQIVASADISTYDDYAGAMSRDASIACRIRNVERLTCAPRATRPRITIV